MAGPTTADRLREQYRLRARLPVYQRRVARAAALIAQARAIGACYVAFSGGKDSMALLHLARAVDPAIPGAFYDSGAETPATLDAVAAMEALGHPVLRIRPELTIVEMLQQVGAWGYDGPNRISGEWHWRKADWKRVLLEEPAERVRAMGYPIALLGLRQEENLHRRIGLRKAGPIHQRKDGAWIAAPLSDWEGDDVLAYCLTHDLPLSSVYLQPNDPERSRRRTGTALGSKASTWGRWQDLRRREPALWADLTAMFPRMRGLG